MDVWGDTLSETGSLPCVQGMKPKKHSVKALPSVTLGKHHTAYTVTAKVYLSSVFYQALGKDVVEC